MQCSPITSLEIDGKQFFVKRDDLIDPYLSGNKYRKLYKLLQTPKERYKKIISYGGTQSNAMLSLAALCKQKGWEFHYYTKPLSTTQLIERDGNFHIALELGMQHHSVSYESYKDVVASLRFELDDATLVVDQGGASEDAKSGLELFAKEIEIQRDILEQHNITALAVPSGTGTTALFMAKALPHLHIYTAACVGDKEYLKKQMVGISQSLPGNLTILEPAKKYHFAKPYQEFYEIYTKLKDGGIEFDLLYAPLMWQELLRQVDERVLYVHSGGVSGNVTMLERYKKKGIAT